MLRASTLLLTTLFVVSPAENILEKYESECRADLGTGPCQRACEFEKIGLMSDGKFDIKKAKAMIDQGELKLYPDYRKNLLRAAFHLCHQEIAPANSLDKCSAASAMYYCVTTILQPERLYKDEERAITNSKVLSNYYGWGLVPCRCGKIARKEVYQASYKTIK